MESNRVFFVAQLIFFGGVRGGEMYFSLELLTQNPTFSCILEHRIFPSNLKNRRNTVLLSFVEGVSISWIGC